MGYCFSFNKLDQRGLYLNSRLIANAQKLRYKSCGSRVATHKFCCCKPKICTFFSSLSTLLRLLPRELRPQVFGPDSGRRHCEIDFQLLTKRRRQNTKIQNLNARCFWLNCFWSRKRTVRQGSLIKEPFTETVVSSFQRKLLNSSS